ncbi:MAG TPA: aminopeptidase [Janthinobacterium sp.]|nr:aminopeptidase [Janthinobacterium sp.]
MHRSSISVAVTTLVALIGLAGLAGAPAAASAPAGASATTTQLPRGVIPSHYALSLVPNAKASTFDAKLTITLEVTRPSDSITLNAADLVFHGATLAGPGGASRAASKISVNGAEQSATFTFAKPLAKGQYHLTLDYSGKIGSQAEGLFALDYDGAGGRQRALYTQFENSDARRMIPSWDEPAYKATFALEATVPADLMAVGNMPIASSRALPDGRKVVTFATTPKMSTYLLFFGLGDFERAAAKVDDTEVGVITQKGALAQGRFALDSSQAVLREYNDYFGVRFPLPKLDNIAAPGRSQFFGAMENWGAVFTFEYGLLLDPAFSTQSDKQEVFLFLSHEMAHQWFGDLVTMRWWDDLWLNEGFASWMESRTTARLHPEWNTALNAIETREKAIGRDALLTTHPVVQHIATVEQASQAFDSITYQKGEAVIRMLEAYVGADAWREGVRSYMRANAYGNTVSNDLWKNIEKAAGKPITAIAHDFTLQAGVPMIRVEADACRDGQTRVTLSQGEFSKDQPDKKARSWRVPVLAQTAGNAPQRVLVAGGKAQLSLPGCGAVLVNAGQSGYYRTLYSPASFASLSSGFAALAPIDQLGVLSDTYALGMAGLQPASNFLDLASATPLNADTQVWGKIASIFDAINDIYKGEPERRRKFADFAIARLTPMMAQTGWQARPGEPDTVANLRNELIAALSDLGDPAVVAEARRRYAADASDPAAMPGPLRKTILAVVARHADATTWDGLRAAARKEKTPLIKNDMYDLLASSEDSALAKRALELALTEEPGATNSPAMISHVSQGHPDLAFDFALIHLEQVNARVDASSRSRYFPRLASHSADPDMIVKLGAYAKANLPASARRDADTSMAAIKYRVKLRSDRLPDIDAWLAHSQQ